jgi:NAD(P)-dependent dehydrogenase (short-subunit alcohol dehydrogenase family)
VHARRPLRDARDDAALARRAARPARLARRRERRGRRCLITGAASGIGRATALAAAARGAELLLTDLHADGLERVADELGRAGGTVRHAAAADVSDHAAIVALAREIHAAHGSMDVVMNIAGVSAWGTIERLEHRHWQQMVDVNLMGPIHVLECFVPPMVAAGRGGHVVNVSSAAGLFGLPWHAAYSASKFGLRGISEVLRFDLRRHGIGVSLVCPGAVRTPLVGTVEIVGVDRAGPGFARLMERFERHAVSPEHVAAKILEGIERDRYMVFTSADIRLGWWAQRLCAPLYALAMRRLGDELNAIADRD